MKKLLKEFVKSLDNKSEDEFFGTEREMGENLSKKFLQWCNKNRKKLQPPPEPLQTHCMPGKHLGMGGGYTETCEVCGRNIYS